MRRNFVGDSWGQGVQSWQGRAGISDAAGRELASQIRVRRQRWGKTGFRACLELPTPSGAIAICADVPDGALDELVRQWADWRGVATGREVSGIDLIGDDEFLGQVMPLTDCLVRCTGPMCFPLLEVGYDAGSKPQAAGGGSNPLGALGNAFAGASSGAGGFNLGGLVTGGLNAFLPGAGTALEGIYNGVKSALNGGRPDETEDQRAVREYREAEQAAYDARPKGAQTRVLGINEVADPNNPVGTGVSVRNTEGYDPAQITTKAQVDAIKNNRGVISNFIPGITMKAAGTPGVGTYETTTGTTPVGLTGGVNSLLGGQTTPGQIAPALGAANAMAQSLALLQSAPELFGGLAGPIGALLRSSLRSVDALTAAQLGDPAAQAIVVQARRQAEGKVARALQIADSFLRV